VIRFGSIAAFINAFVNIATFLVVIFLIGIPAITDVDKFIDLVTHNPFPILLEDLLKFLSAGLTCVLIWVLYQNLHSSCPTLMFLANIFGFLSVLCLVINATLSLYTILQAAFYTQNAYELGSQLNATISVLGVGAIFFNGVWYLLVSWSVLKNDKLPKLFSYLGLGIGIVSLIPLLGIFVLVISVIWSVWLGLLLLKQKPVEF
jgi:Domain of unknown function (DUF4386)